MTLPRDPSDSVSFVGRPLADENATVDGHASPPIPGPATVANSSGDGLGIQRPGSMTWGARIATPAPSGRARDRAKCLAFTGTVSYLTRGLPIPPAASATRDASVSRLSFEDPETEAAVCALEIKWLRAGIIKNSNSSRTFAGNEIKANSGSA